VVANPCGTGGLGGGSPSVSPTIAGTGTTNRGGGGGGGSGYSPLEGGNGGSGVVVIKESATTFVTAPGVWSINDVYDNVKAGTWSN
jgi:hypothetical protein